MEPADTLKLLHAFEGRCVKLKKSENQEFCCRKQADGEFETGLK